MDIKDFKCSDTENNYLTSLIGLLKGGLSKENLASEVSGLIQNYKRKPVSGLIRGIITDIECHLGIYEDDERDFKPRQDFDYFAGINYFSSILDKLLSSENFNLQDNIYKTYLRWFYYNKEKIEVEVLFMDAWNFNLYKSKSDSEFYLSIIFSQSFASWNVDYKVEGMQKQKVLLAIKDNSINESILNEVVNFYRQEYSKDKYK